MTNTTPTALSVSTQAGVRTITLNRPDVRNAFNDAVIAELNNAFTEAGQAADVRCVVLAAEGPAFCAGADLNWMRRMADYTRDENLADAGQLAAMLRAIYECPKPTVARVQGDVFAGGVGLVAACDMVVSVDAATVDGSSPQACRLARRTASSDALPHTPQDDVE